jgi:hypothetical protein
MRRYGGVENINCTLKTTISSFFSPLRARFYNSRGTKLRAFCTGNSPDYRRLKVQGVNTRKLILCIATAAFLPSETIESIISALISMSIH